MCENKEKRESREQSLEMKLVAVCGPGGGATGLMRNS